MYILVSKENLDIAELVYKTIEAVQYNTHPIDQGKNIYLEKCIHSLVVVPFFNIDIESYSI